ncbi:hypothetical protein COY95_01305, partial [Candidatus Woesearchaeota archaeon CG_4_10_14_0_8_um_filter_47_5]
MEYKINELKAFVKKRTDQATYEHVRRVAFYARRISQETHADLNVVTVAALLHELHRGASGTGIPAGRPQEKGMNRETNEQDAQANTVATSITSYILNDFPSEFKEETNLEFDEDFITLVANCVEQQEQQVEQDDINPDKHKTKSDISDDILEVKVFHDAHAVEIITNGIPLIAEELGNSGGAGDAGKHGANPLPDFFDVLKRFQRRQELLFSGLFTRSAQAIASSARRANNRFFSACLSFLVPGARRLAIALVVRQDAEGVYRVYLRDVNQLNKKGSNGAKEPAPQKYQPTYQKNSQNQSPLHLLPHCETSVYEDETFCVSGLIEGEFPEHEAILVEKTGYASMGYKFAGDAHFHFVHFYLVTLEDDLPEGLDAGSGEASLKEGRWVSLSDLPGLFKGFGSYEFERDI